MNRVIGKALADLHVEEDLLQRHHVLPVLGQQDEALSTVPVLLPWLTSALRSVFLKVKRLALKDNTFFILLIGGCLPDFIVVCIILLLQRFSRRHLTLRLVYDYYRLVGLDVFSLNTWPLRAIRGLKAAQTFRSHRFGKRNSINFIYF